MLARLREVQSVAQLGQRLHALVDREVAEPASRLAHALADADVEARVVLGRASLEDVFVASTRRLREAGAQA